jgi:hypothetical protein
MFKDWNWTPRAYKIRDQIVIGSCLLAWFGTVMLFLIKATD